MRSPWRFPCNHPLTLAYVLGICHKDPVTEISSFHLLPKQWPPSQYTTTKFEHNGHHARDRPFYLPNQLHHLCCVPLTWVSHSHTTSPDSIECDPFLACVRITYHFGIGSLHFFATRLISTCCPGCLYPRFPMTHGPSSCFSECTYPWLEGTLDNLTFLPCQI